MKNSNRRMSIKELESIVNKLLKQKAPSPDEFTDELYQIFTEIIIAILFQKIHVEGIILSPFMRPVLP